MKCEELRWKSHWMFLSHYKEPFWESDSLYWVLWPGNGLYLSGLTDIPSNLKGWTRWPYGMALALIQCQVVLLLICSWTMKWFLESVEKFWSFKEEGRLGQWIDVIRGRSDASSVTRTVLSEVRPGCSQHSPFLLQTGVGMACKQCLPSAALQEKLRS